MKPSVISVGYEIEIVNRLKVETNKIGRGCRLELDGHTFIINLIPFRHDSFDVIVGMDWLYLVELRLFCFEIIVLIPYPTKRFWKIMENVLKGNGKIETMKVDEQNIKGIPIVRNFPGVFPEDSTGFIPIYVKLSFVIDLFPLEDYACSKFTLTF
ncbi:hypothetical protein Tco_0617252 [Tanacetum coccineum]